MINFEFKIGSNVLSFNRILTDEEQLLSESELIVLDAYLSTKTLVLTNPISYTKDESYDYMNKFQYSYYDETALFSLINLKTMMIINTNRNATEELILQMILAVEKWINKLWYIYTEYKIQLEMGMQVSSIEINISEIPCLFYDILWVANFNNYRLKEPSRVVNQDVNFYINYIP